MNKYENNKLDQSSTHKSNKTSEFEDKDQSNVVHVNLEKSASITNEPGRYFVLPAGGMHFAVPELNFHINHFKEEPPEDNNKKRLSKSSDSLPNMNSYNKSFQKSFKLPYGLELTAGPGQKKEESSAGTIKKKAPPPSETLLASAAMIKSYFLSSQEKDADADTETVKNKMLGLWHNMKYGWSSNLKTKFSKETPIFLLGKIYHRAFKEQQVYGETAGFVCSNVEDFKRDFSSLSWFTYRRKFPPILESNLTTDCGWGCMIRSGQMMMLTALKRHFLPQDWSFQEAKNDAQSEIYKKLMKLFCDDPSPKCPFSLHNLIFAGHKMNKKAGSWYGPSCVAYMFKDAVEEGAKEIPSLNRLGVYVAQDGAVYVQDVLDLCSTNKCVCNTSSEDKAMPNGSNSYCLPDCKAFENDQVSSSSTSHKSSVESGISFHLDSCSELVEEDRDQFNSRSTSTPLEFKNIPMDAFVDSNRKKYDNFQQNAFGNALVTRVQELSPDNKIAPIDEASCPRCSGWKSCIIFIPVRLGGTTVNPIYYNCIYSLFLHDLCIGIIGGRPKHSLYFVGFQDDSLIHLDPHLSQDALSLDDVDYPLNTYHCYSPRKISISKMDPSATIGFYCHTRSQFFRLLEETQMIATAKDGNLDSPIFEFIDGRSKDVNGWIDKSFGEEVPNMHVSSFDSSKWGSGSELQDETTSFEEAEELVFED